jgi:hypothetical protein
MVGLDLVGLVGWLDLDLVGVWLVVISRPHQPNQSIHQCHQSISGSEQCERVDSTTHWLFAPQALSLLGSLHREGVNISRVGRTRRGVEVVMCLCL